MAHGYPTPPGLLEDYTRRQLMLFHRQAERRENRARADQIENLRAVNMKNINTMISKLRK